MPNLARVARGCRLLIYTCIYIGQSNPFARGSVNLRGGDFEQARRRIIAARFIVSIRKLHQSHGNLLGICETN